MPKASLKTPGTPPASLDEDCMRRALALARRGEGRTRPNPPVGALVLRQGVVIGEGWHHRAGAPHAEIEALKGLTAEQTAGATLYVTLEPCSTHGRTPPCTEAILRAGIARVVVSASDPNPKHRGRGLRLLQRQGVEVVRGVCRADGETLIAPFSKWIQTGRPYVTLKMGMSLDGRISDRTGRSRWITGAVARQGVHDLRRRADAILVGLNTVQADDPSLCWSRRAALNPCRIVLDARGELPLQAKVFSDGQADHTIVAATSAIGTDRKAAIEGLGARVWICGDGPRVDLDALLAACGREGFLHVLCEGGGELAAALVRQRLVDDLWFYVAPRFIGSDGIPVLGGEGWLLDQTPSLRIQSVAQVGEDVLIRAVPGGDKCLQA